MNFNKCYDHSEQSCKKKKKKEKKNELINNKPRTLTPKIGFTAKIWTNYALKKWTNRKLLIKKLSAGSSENQTKRREFKNGKSQPLTQTSTEIPLKQVSQSRKLGMH